MASGQQSLTSFFKRKENTEEPVNNVAKKGKISSDSSNVTNDDLIKIQTLSRTVLLSDMPLNINDNRPLTSTANDNKKRTYQKWYSDSFPWLLYESNKGGFYHICRDYWKPTTPSFSEMNTRTRGTFVIHPFINWRHAPGPNGSLQKHQDSYSLY
ncbi:unnamed protein product [Adineta ricciae]|uniref:Uncharacterized protein n=1 Tax=Adineta ricciae TaxID=249248 RepID=A0A815E9R6_ADIRI|nr:unnamed protein product [Adineta ricciae]CAF1307465.1 unnamed protein product [Adineta ricciae]